MTTLRATRPRVELFSYRRYGNSRLPHVNRGLLIFQLRRRLLS